MNIERKVQCVSRDKGFYLSFEAMASPCEVLIDTKCKDLAIKLGHAVANEAWRIQDKFSRYQASSICSQLNDIAGSICTIDQETFLLLQFADQAHQLSDGRFDITSGILRKAWHFDGSDNIPTQSAINELMPLIGWPKVTLTPSSFQMQPNMEIDLGGLGKEYAVDKALQCAVSLTDAPVLINFGGDIAVSGARENQSPWHIGIEAPAAIQGNSVQSNAIVEISTGAIATSGDAQRFLEKDGKRYSHVLNVKTGWPVKNAPSSVTVAAPNCIQAGLLATLALLQGEQAQAFLKQAEVKYWLID